MTPVPFSLIGPGAVGSTLARYMVAAGYRPLTIVGKSPAPHRLVVELHTESGSSITQISDKSELILIAVPDTAILEVARSLAWMEMPWEKISVLHTSGSRTAEVLLPLEKKGAGVASFHPYMTFPSFEQDPDLKDVTFGIDGNEQGVNAAFGLAMALGGSPVRIPPEMRILYHLSAVLASGCVSADLLMAAMLLKKAGLSDKRALHSIFPIVIQTISNSKDLGPEQAMTGPAVRHDEGTVRRHLDAIREHAPEIEEVYRAMTHFMRSTAENKPLKKKR